MQTLTRPHTHSYYSYNLSPFLFFFVADAFFNCFYLAGGLFFFLQKKKTIPPSIATAPLPHLISLSFHATSPADSLHPPSAPTFLSHPSFSFPIHPIHTHIPKAQHYRLKIMATLVSATSFSPSLDDGVFPLFSFSFFCQ